MDNQRYNFDKTYQYMATYSAKWCSREASSGIISRSIADIDISVLVEIIQRLAELAFNQSSSISISILSHNVLNNSFICTSPAKIFNLTDLEIFNIIANSNIRNKFNLVLKATG